MNAELCCAVLSYRDEPFLVEAVRSLLNQCMPVEVVVVNSGGGEPALRLARAGITVPVISVPERLYAGGARNIGIRHTRAPLVAFLAADCLATAGWAAGRIAAHRKGARAVASVLTNADRESGIGWAALLLIHHRRIRGASQRQQLLYSLSYERSLFVEHGLFREDLPGGEDTEFNARLSRGERVVLARDVVTAHRYPSTLRDFLADARRRGQLQARMQGALEGRGPRRLLVAARGPLSVVHSLLASLRSPRDERWPLLRAWPLVVLGSISYAAGALSAGGGQEPSRGPGAWAPASPCRRSGPRQPP
ncbi:MAG: glycosyltransferase family A protein [Synechococcaceae cyanobacterium]|nr:glycosyltransferase family A protein [Synechococcaceae cyanobacterium]